MSKPHATRTVLLVGLLGLYVVGRLATSRPSHDPTRLDPMTPTLRSAELALRDGHLDEALALANALRASHPGDPFVLFLSATILDAQQHWAEAAAMWDEYLARTSAPDTACPHVAMAYERAGDSNRALQRFRTCAAHDPDNPARLADLARALAGRRETNEARQLFDRAIALDPSDPSVAAHLAALDRKSP